MVGISDHPVLADLDIGDLLGFGPSERLSMDELRRRCARVRTLLHPDRSSQRPAGVTSRFDVAQANALHDWLRGRQHDSHAPTTDRSRERAVYEDIANGHYRSWNPSAVDVRTGQPFGIRDRELWVAPPRARPTPSGRRTRQQSQSPEITGTRNRTGRTPPPRPPPPSTPSTGARSYRPPPSSAGSGPRPSQSTDNHNGEDDDEDDGEDVTFVGARSAGGAYSFVGGPRERFERPAGMNVRDPSPSASASDRHQQQGRRSTTTGGRGERQQRTDSPPASPGHPEGLEVLLRLAGPSGARVAVALVPLLGETGAPLGDPYLVVTVGTDSLGRVRYQVTGRDFAGHPTATGSWSRGNSTTYEGLLHRRARFLGRFAGPATENQIREFAVALSRQPGNPNGLPLASREPRRSRSPRRDQRRDECRWRGG